MNKMKKNFWVLVLISLLTCSFLACSRKKDAQEVPKKESQDLALQQLTSSYRDVYQDVLKGTVVVYNYTIYNGVEVLTSSGSGFIYHEDESYYYLITNQHVIDKSVAVRVVFYNRALVQVKVLGQNANQDVAVLRVEKSRTPAGVKVLNLGERSLFANPEVGEATFAVGTPGQTQFYNSLSVGVVAGINRVIGNEAVESIQKEKHGIQIDLAINSGNSGGPLFNAAGEVIGVNTLKLYFSSGDNNDTEGLNFALPIHDMYLVAEKIRNSFVENVKNGVFEPADLSSNNRYQSVALTNYVLRQKYGITTNQGVLVISQSSDSVLGCNDYSIIKEIKGYPVKSTVDLRRVLYECQPNESVKLKILEYNNGYSEIEKNVNLIKYRG